MKGGSSWPFQGAGRPSDLDATVGARPAADPTTPGGSAVGPVVSEGAVAGALLHVRDRSATRIRMSPVANQGPCRRRIETHIPGRSMR